MLADLALEQWADLPAAQQSDVSNNTYFHQFVGFTIAASVAGGLSSALLLCRSQGKHTNTWKGALKDTKSPMHYFTSNPLGRIMNKFAADRGVMDEILPQTLFQCMGNFFLCLGGVVLAVVAVPWTALPLIPLLIILVHQMVFSPKF